MNLGHLFDDETLTDKTYSVDLSEYQTLISGCTNSGKSHFLRSVLTQLIEYPNIDIRIGDSKFVTFAEFECLSLVQRIAHTAKEHDEMLIELVGEMNDRYKFMKKYQLKDLKGNSEYKRIVAIIDEFENLVLDPTYGKSVMQSLTTLATLSRASMIHILYATQYPIAKVVSPRLKANSTLRISFKLMSATNSRVILDTSGAEKLQRQGEMLIRSPWMEKCIRLQGVYMSDNDVNDAIGRAVAKQEGRTWSKELMRVV